jgi:hypothetical protein
MHLGQCAGQAFLSAKPEASPQAAETAADCGTSSVHFPDVPKEKADLMHAIYERITVAGPEIVGVRLTAAAYAHRKG